MNRREGKIIVQGEDLSPEKLLELEQILNARVAAEIFAEQKILIRVHLE